MTHCNPLVFGVLGDGFEEICRRIRAQSGGVTPYVLGIAGASASGKTTLAKRLHEAFPESQLLSTDDYFRGRTYMQEHGIAAFDDPSAVDLPRLALHLAILKYGRTSVHKPIYSFLAGEPTGEEWVSSAPLIIVEGIFAIRQELQFPPSLFDCKVFVEISTHSSLIRRFVRDLRDPARAHQTPQEILDMFVNQVYPGYQAHVAPTRAYADMVVQNELTPAETEQFPETQFQAKARIHANAPCRPRFLIVEPILSLGTTCKRDFILYDIFFLSPATKDLIKFSVTLLEGNSFVLQNRRLVYKSPLRGSRRKLLSVALGANQANSLADDGTERSLEELGYTFVGIIVKYRALFIAENGAGEIALDTDLLMADENSSIDDDRGYIEVRTSDKESLKCLMKRVRDAGLIQGRWTTRSYWEILQSRKNKTPKSGSP